ncbi:MAG: hypothetical protein C4318_06515 [Acidimicrobiia bacterium]
MAGPYAEVTEGVGERVGDGVGEGVGDGDGEGERLGVGDGVGEALTVGEGVGFAVRVGEGKRVGEGVGEGCDRRDPIANARPTRAMTKSTANTMTAIIRPRFFFSGSSSPAEGVPGGGGTPGPV